LPTETIGYTSIGASNASIGNVIRGSRFTVPNDGVDRYPITISAYCDMTTGPGGNVKFAIYKVSDNSKVADTYASIIYGTPAWVTCAFPAPFVKLLPNTEYYLQAWSDEVENCIRYVAESGKGAYENRTYGVWPATLTPTAEDKKCSIYVTVSKDVGDGVTKTWYGRSGATITQNGHNGYHLDPANTSSAIETDITQPPTLPITVYLGVKIYRVAPGHVETEMTSGVSCILSKTITVAGYTSGDGAAYNLSACKINADDALMVQVYGGTVNPPTTLLTTFICETADLEKCLSFKGTWTPTYYVHTLWDDEAQLYFVTFVFGHATYKFKVVVGEPRLIDELTRLVDTTVNWSESVETKYLGVTFKKKIKADLESAIDALSDWKDVLTWSARCLKLGIEREAKIKAALDSSTMVNGLPKSGNDGSDYFHSYDAELLYGFYWADKWSYQTSKWNKLTGKDNLKTALANAGRGFLIYYSTTSYYLGTNRFYDENGQCLRNILLFRDLLGYSDAQTKAEDLWTYLNAHHWGNDMIETHFGYTSVDAAWECEGGGFLSAIAFLEYFNRALTNIDRLYTDLRNRTNRNRWFAPIWMDPNTNCSCVLAMVHAWASNAQHRLQNTLMIWAAIMGTWIHQSSDSQNDLKAMLEGYMTGGSYKWRPAWLLLQSEKGGLYIPSTDLWKGVTTDSSGTNLGAAKAAVLSFMLGIVPDTAMLAITLEEIHYEYIHNIADPDLFQLDIANRKVTVSIYAPGNVKFLFGSSVVQQNFTQSGVFELTFASDWNSITNVTRNSDLPSNRKYLGFQTVEVNVYSVNSASSSTFPACTYSVFKDAAAGSSGSNVPTAEMLVNAESIAQVLAQQLTELGVPQLAGAGVLATAGQECVFNAQKDAAAVSQALAAVQSTFNFAGEPQAGAGATMYLGLEFLLAPAAVARALAQTAWELHVPVGFITQALTEKSVMSLFNVQQQPIVRLLADVFAPLTREVYSAALVRAVADLIAECGLVHIACVQASAEHAPQVTFNVDKIPGSSVTSTALYQLAFNVSKGAVAAALAAVLAEIATEAFEIFKDAIASGAAGLAAELILPMQAATRSLGAVSLERILSVAKDAISLASAQDATLIDWSMANDAATLVFSVPGLEQTLNLRPDARVRLLVEVSVATNEVIVVRRVILLSGVAALELHCPIKSVILKSNDEVVELNA